MRCFPADRAPRQKSARWSIFSLKNSNRLSEINVRSVTLNRLCPRPACRLRQERSARSATAGWTSQAIRVADMDVSSDTSFWRLFGAAVQRVLPRPLSARGATMPNVNYGLDSQSLEQAVHYTRLIWF